MPTLEEMMDTHPSVHRENRKGRNPREGYIRSNGIRWRFSKQIEEEADFQEAMAVAKDRTIVARTRLMNLYLLIRFYLPRLERGHIVEFGSYRGGSAMFMAKLAQRHLPGVDVFALDTFTGMPTVDKRVDGHHAGDFAKDVSFEDVRDAANQARLTNLKVVPGLFDHTLPGILETHSRIALSHIDCDIYESAMYAWQTTNPHMVPGGYVVFDDATEPSCLGATEAVEELICAENLRAEQISPHFVFRYPPLPD